MTDNSKTTQKVYTDEELVILGRKALEKKEATKARNKENQQLNKKFLSSRKAMRGGQRALKKLTRKFLRDARLTAFEGKKVNQQKKRFDIPTLDPVIDYLRNYCEDLENARDGEMDIESEEVAEKLREQKTFDEDDDEDEEEEEEEEEE